MTPFFVSDFLNYLKVEKRYSSHTILAYQEDLQTFEEFVRPNTLQEIDTRIVRSFVYFLKEQKLDNSSINRKISALHSFYKWMEKNSYIKGNPLSKTLLLKQPKRLPVFVREEELQDTRALFNLDSFEGFRDYLMVEFFYQTGMRLSELIELKVSDVKGTSIDVIGKRNKERIIPISDALLQLTKEYIERRKSIAVKCEQLFVKLDGNKLYPKLVYRKINAYLSIVSKVQKKSPHVLRHTFATQLLNHGAGIEAIKELLGHADLRATQVYTHNTFEQLKHVYSQAHPRGHKN